VALQAQVRGALARNRLLTQEREKHWEWKQRQQKGGKVHSKFCSVM
jgi:hypothetical protein